jgi:large subunit ribosomal protein L6
MDDKINEVIEMPEKVTAIVAGDILTIKGPNGEVNAKLSSETVHVLAETSKIIFTAGRNTKKERQFIGTFKAHIRNMITGVTDGHHYKMKVCSGHFPMNVTVNGQEFSVKNFVGEKTPRKLTIPQGIKVKVKGNDIDLESCDKHLVSNFAGSRESLTKRTNFDKRIFQDGIILTEETNE